MAIPPSAATACTLTGFVRDSINLSAALVNPKGVVTGDLDATGCNIGVFYGAGVHGTVSGASVHGANYFGIGRRRQRRQLDRLRHRRDAAQRRPARRRDLFRLHDRRHRQHHRERAVELPEGRHRGERAARRSGHRQQQRDRPGAGQLHRPERHPGGLRRQGRHHREPCGRQFLHGCRGSLERRDHPGRRRLLRRQRAGEYSRGAEHFCRQRRSASGSPTSTRAATRSRPRRSTRRSSIRSATMR